MKSNRKKAAKKIVASEVHYTIDSQSQLFPDVYVSSKNDDVESFQVIKNEDSTICVQLSFYENRPKVTAYYKSIGLDGTNIEEDYIYLTPFSNEDETLPEYSLNVFAPESPNEVQTGYHKPFEGVTAFICWPN